MLVCLLVLNDGLNSLSFISVQLKKVNENLSELLIFCISNHYRRYRIKMNKLNLNLSKSPVLLAFVRYLAAKPGGGLGGKVGGSNK